MSEAIFIFFLSFFRTKNAYSFFGGLNFEGAERELVTPKKFYSFFVKQDLIALRSKPIDLFCLYRVAYDYHRQS